MSFCWLPAVLGVDQKGTRLLAGYVDVATGAEVFEPLGNEIVVANVPVSAASTSPQWGLEAQPKLLGEPFVSWSNPLQGWLPARPEMVAPDGIHYAYRAADRSIHMVAATTQTDQVVLASNPNDLNPIGYSNDGVWLVQGAGQGLWLIDASTQALIQVRAPSSQEFWNLFRGGAIWGANTGGFGSAPPSSLLHFDPKSRTVSTWYSQAGAIVSLAAVDANGVAAVVTSSGSGAADTLVAVTAPGQSRVLSMPGGVDPIPLLSGREETDSHGGWVVARSGTFLFNSTSGVRSIGAAVSGDVVPAGECQPASP